MTFNSSKPLFDCVLDYVLDCTLVFLLFFLDFPFYLNFRFFLFNGSSSGDEVWVALIILFAIFSNCLLTDVESFFSSLLICSVAVELKRLSFHYFLKFLFDIFNFLMYW